MKRCNTCGVFLSEKSYAYMNGAGESTISEISIFDEDLILCPKCTNELSKFLSELVKYNKQKNIKLIKKQKVIELNKYKENL